MPLVIGVDSSTQSTKVEARNAETGEVMGTGSAPHPPAQPPVSEQDPEAWWDALVAAVSQLPDDVRKDVAAISVAGQQHGLVLVDSAGAVVRPAKLWNDTTSAEQASALVERLGAGQWAALCRSVPVAAFTITKLLWMADNEPESLARADKIMLPHDYLTWCLTGKHITDRGDASGTGWFDPVSNTYQPELLATAVDDAASWLQRLPTIVAHDEAAGELTVEGAAALGLSPGIVVGAGSGDNMGAALGLGLRVGDLVMSLGTSGTIYSLSALPTSDPSGAVAGFASASGEYLPLVCTLNATRVTDSVAEWMGTDAAGLSALASAPSARFDGCTLVPYFDGERTPNRPDESGRFHGLRTTTTRETLALAAHDGVLCGLFDGLDHLTSAGVDVSGRLHLVGGGARSATYRQRCADLHDRTILVPTDQEVVATGAASQAASIALDVPVNDIAKAWSLGSGLLIEPADSNDAPKVRAAYAELTR